MRGRRLAGDGIGALCYDTASLGKTILDAGLRCDFGAEDT
jgi:hypothetical protein